MRMSITIKPIHSICIGKEKCSGCLLLTRKVLEEINMINISIFEEKAYFDCDNISDLLLEFNNRNIRIDKWSKE